jgi:transposase
VNQHFYIQVLTILQEMIREEIKFVELQLHFAPRQRTTGRQISVRLLLAGKQIPKPKHAPYSSDLDPCGFLFPKLKSSLKRSHFQSTEDIHIRRRQSYFKHFHTMISGNSSKP